MRSVCPPRSQSGGQVLTKRCGVGKLDSGMPMPSESENPSNLIVPTRGELTVRVRYAECDPMGVAHHASYAPWLEMGRTELLREAGKSYAALEAAGVFLVITKLELRYRRPIRYDDLLTIRTQVVGGSRIKIRHEYEVVLVERDGNAPDPNDPATPANGIASVGMTELACVGSSGRPQPLPDWLAAGS